MFDIASVLKDTAANAGDARKLENITLHLIDENPKNQYSMEGIEELADNIEAVGLLEPLIVKKTDGGRYMLLSGHRRRAALRKIAERAEDYPASMSRPVPCLVEPKGAEDDTEIRKLLEELKLLFANSDTRVLTSADTAFQVRRIREVLTELRDRGYSLPGKMRDHVAAAAKVSATRIARLDVIDRSLTEPKLRKAWREGTLGETSAYEIARYPAGIQKLAEQRVGAKVLGGMKTENVVAVMEACVADGNQDREETERWNNNVQTMRDASPADSFSADAYLARRAQEDEDFSEMLDVWAETFFRELDEIDSRQAGIETLKKRFRSWGHYGGAVNADGSGKGLTLYRSGKQKILRTWTEVYDMLCLDALYREAQRQQVSAEDTEPEPMSAAPGWNTGTPEQPGHYVVRIGVPKIETKGSVLTTILRWSDDGWTDSRGIPKRLNVYRWVRLPEVER